MDKTDFKILIKNSNIIKKIKQIAKKIDNKYLNEEI